MDKKIDEVEFTIFDTETTGLQAQAGDRIVELAAVKFLGAERRDSFHSLVNPGRPVSAAAFAVNGITQEILKGAPRIEELFPQFLEFIRGTCLCSYNAGFDLEFLNQELKLAGWQALEDIVVVDVLKMARRLLPGLERYALWFVAERLGLNTRQQHRALSDVELTWEVFSRLKEVLLAKGVSDFSDFSSLFAINPHLLETVLSQRSSQIQEAIDLGAKLKIKYLSSSGAQLTEREVLPKEIRQENGRAYLVGYCCLRKEERTFRIDGILRLELV